jgi:hypothetical protein
MQGFWQGQSPAQPSWPALALGLVLVVLGNALSALPGGAMGDEGWPLVGVKLALLGLALAWARRVAGLGLGEIGLGERGWWRHGLLGVGVGAMLAAPIAAYLLFPLGIPGGQVGYQGEETMGLGPFLPGPWCASLWPPPCSRSCCFGASYRPSPLDPGGW